MTSSSIRINEYHYPDEFVDSAILFDEPETGEDHNLPSAKDILSYIVPLRRFRKEVETKGESFKTIDEVNLSDYHLPDEYCDPAVVFSYDDKTSESNDEALLHSSQDIVRSLFSLDWLRSNDDTTVSAPALDTSSSSDMDSSNCHLPEDYIDPTLTYKSPPRSSDTSSSTGDLLLDSIAAFMKSGDEDDKEKDEDGDSNGEVSDGDSSESTRGLSFNECDLPDECVLPEMFSSATESSHTMSLDRLNDKIRKVLSFDRPANKLETSEKIVKGSITIKVTTGNGLSRERCVAWEKSKSQTSIDLLDSQVPRATASRERLLLRKRTPSKSKVGS